MDILIPLILGLLAAGVIWVLAIVLDNKLQKKQLSLVDTDGHDLYSEDMEG